MIDLMCFRQSYERREIAQVCWIKGGTNPTDAITKSMCSHALKDVIDSNTIIIENSKWVERVTNTTSHA